MKKTLITIAALMFVFSMYSAAYAVTATTTLESVSVMLDRAEEVRTGSADLSTGINKVEIRDIPQGAMLDTVRVKVGNSETTVIGISIVTVPIAEPPGEQYRALVAQILALSDEITADNDAVRILIVQADIAAKLLENSRKSIAVMLLRGEVPGDVTGKVQALTAKMSDCRERAAALSKVISDKRKKLDDLNKKLASEFGAKRPNEIVLTVEVEAKSSVKAAIELKYQVFNCGWAPSYEVNIKPTEKKMDITYNATVWQQTGSDWKDVQMTLATSTPSLAMTPPDLKPWSVSLMVAEEIEEEAEEQSIRYAGRRGGAKAPSKNAEVEKESVEHSRAAEPAPMAKREGDLGVSIVMPGRITMSTGSRVAFKVADISLNADIRDYCAPRVSPSVFIKATAINTSEFPLLPARASCFVEGTMTGTTVIGTFPSGAEMNLAIGVDRRVKVERKVTLDKSDERGAKMRREFEFKTEITNSAATEVTLELKDQLPISDNDDIKVNDPDFSEKPTEKNAEGILTWKLTLKPGEKRVISIKYYVEWPKDKQINL